jgi:hypothetical protein
MSLPPAMPSMPISSGGAARPAPLRPQPAGRGLHQTLAALNVPADDRVRQIMANLERWRWLPQELPRDRIQVNIAAAVLTVFDGDTPVMSMRAVTGRPGDETPMLSSTIRSIVLNPPWNVPTSIATKELWPKEKKSPGYFKRNGFTVIDGTRLQQAAGDQSALGRFKFDFDNQLCGLSPRHARRARSSPASAASPAMAACAGKAGRARRAAAQGRSRLAARGDRRGGGDRQDAARPADQTRSRSICSTGRRSPARAAR